MSLPDTLEASLGEEDAVAEVQLGGEDRLVVTPSRTLVYRADGLLSDETVETYSHDVDRIDVHEGRRKAKLTLDYGLDGEETFKLPGSRLDDALHPMLAGALSASGVTGPGESVLRTFRFSELTLVITDHQLVKHIGSVTWDDDFEQFDFEDVTDLDFEEGTVATSIVLTLGDRQERFKAPNEEARVARETLSRAVCNHHDVASLEELRLTLGVDEPAEPARDPADFGAGPDPLDTSGVEGDEDVEPMLSSDAAGAAADADADEPAAAAADHGVDDVESELNTGATTAEFDDSADDRTDAEGRHSTTGRHDDGGRDDNTAATDSTVSDQRSSDRNDSAAESATATSTATGTGTESKPERSDETADEGATAFEGSGFEPAGVDEADVAAEVAELHDVVEAQSEQLERQSELIEQLVEELRRGR